MSPRTTWAVAARVLAQLRRDHRTLGLLLVMPCLILALLRWMYADRQLFFDSIAPALVALIPFIVMFLVTSVTMLRERSSGTLERLLALPVGKLDLLLGYALAFGLLGALQATLAVALCVGPLGLDVAGPVAVLVLVAVADAVLASAFGLFVSAFARTEFQAVQFMPAVVFPQLLLCGLLLPRGQLPSELELLSDAFPLTYAVEAIGRVVTDSGVAADVWVDLGVVAVFTVALLGFGAATLRRRTA